MADVVAASTVSMSSGCRANDVARNAATTDGNESGSRNRPKKPSTREKIAKMVADGAVNYPAYLKLIYTGDSEQEPSSSEDEFSIESRDHQRRTGTRNLAPTSVSSGNGSESIKLQQQLLRQRNSANGDFSRCDDDLPSDKLFRQDTLGKQQEHQHISTTFRSSAPSEGYNCQESDSGHVTPTPKNSPDVATPEETAKLREDLIKLQDDITTLRSVLNTKMARAAALRQQLGRNAMADLRNSLITFKQSQTYQKTNAALRSFSAYASKAVGNLRHSVAFKSVEEKVGSLRTSQSMSSIRFRLNGMRSSKSENNVSTATMPTGAASIDSLDRSADEDDFYTNDNTMVDSRQIHHASCNFSSETTPYTYGDLF